MKCSRRRASTSPRSMTGRRSTSGSVGPGRPQRDGRVLTLDSGRNRIPIAVARGQNPEAGGGRVGRRARRPLFLSLADDPQNNDEGKAETAARYRGTPPPKSG